VTERDIACREFVELVTDYLEESLDPAVTSSMEEHLVFCAPCVHYLEQMQLTSDAVARVASEGPSGIPDSLKLAFRDWSRT
jgi:hypothetical protein